MLHPEPDKDGICWSLSNGQGLDDVTSTSTSLRLTSGLAACVPGWPTHDGDFRINCGYESAGTQTEDDDFGRDFPSYDGDVGVVVAASRRIRIDGEDARTAATVPSSALESTEVVPVKVLPALPICLTGDEDKKKDRRSRQRRRRRCPGRSTRDGREQSFVQAVGKTVSGTGLALIVAGLVSAAMGVYGYTISGGGRYYLGFGLLSGVTTSIAGCAGIKAGRKFGDKHFVRGYVVLVGFSLLTTTGLLVLSYLALVRHPGRVVDALAGSVSCLAVLTSVIDTLALALCCCYCPPSPSKQGTSGGSGNKPDSKTPPSSSALASSSSSAHLVAAPAADSRREEFRKKIFGGVLVAKDKIGNFVAACPSVVSRH